MMADQSVETNRTIKILAVEDSPTQAEQLKYLLEERGYAVAVASNGLQALDAIRQRKPNLIISDIVMPQMDGYQLCREVKSDEQLRDIPVLLITSLSEPQDVIKGLECGADGFIRKPYDEKHLISRIEYLWANQALRQQQQGQMGLEIYLGGQRHFITAERQQILDMLLSTYVEAVRLNEGLNRSNQWLHGLYRIAEGLNQTQSEGEVYDVTLTGMVELPGIRTGWIFLREGESDIRLAAAMSGSPPMLEAATQEGNCHCLQMLLTGQFTPTTRMLECEPLHKAAGNRHDSADHVSIPLWAGDRIFGVMNLIAEEQATFSDEELLILNGVGNQIGIALERAHLRDHLEEMVAERTAALESEIIERKMAEKEAQRHLELLHTLRAIDEAIISVQEMPITLDTIIRHIAVQSQVDAIALMLFDGQTEELSCIAATGFARDTIWRTHRRLGQGYVGRVAVERQLVFVRDLNAAGDFGRISLVKEEEFISYLAVPLVVQDKLKGVLEIFHRTSLDPKPEWLEFLQGLALQTAIAIDHADLFAQTQHLLERTQEQARQMEQILDTMPEGVLFLDREHRIILANPAARAYLPVLTDRRTDKILSRLGSQPLTAILQPPQVSSGVPLWQEVVAEESRQIFEVVAQPLRAAAQMEGWVVMLREVTQERQRNEALRRQERLATMGQLAAGIAHDFNNILTPILLYAEIGVGMAPVASRLHANLKQMVIAANRARELVAQILTFGRQDTNQKRRPVHLQPVIKEALRLVRAGLPTTISIQQTLQATAGPVLADPIQLHQVVMNLCTNAYQAMQTVPSGVLRVDLDTVLVDAKLAAARPNLKEDIYVRLTVSDTGHGMDQATLAHIFEPFFTTKPPGEGTGMGLSVVYGIVTENNGDILVESAPGQGTSFAIYLPQVNPETATAEAQGTALSRGTEHILVVDDEEVIAQAASEILESLGYTVTAATNSRAALEIVRHQPTDIDLVFTDLSMPEMTGAELATQLRRIRPDLPIVLTTGYREAITREEAQTAGAHELLSKPYSIGNLSRIIRHLLDSRS